MLEPATPNEILNRVQSPPPPVDVQGDLGVVATTLIEMGWVNPGSQCDLSQLTNEMYFFHFFQYFTLPHTFRPDPGGMVGIQVNPGGMVGIW